MEKITATTFEILPQIRRMIVDIPADKEAEVMNQIIKGEYYATATFQGAGRANPRIVQVRNAEPTGQKIGEYFLVGEDLGAVN